MIRLPSNSAEAHGCTALGATAADARRRLGGLLAANHAGRYDPYLVTWRGRTGFVWRAPVLGLYAAADAPPESWHFVLIDDGAGYVGTGACVHCFHDRDEAIAALHYRLAQDGWRGTPDDIAACAAFCCEGGSHCHGAAAFRQWCDLLLAIDAAIQPVAA